MSTTSLTVRVPHELANALRTFAFVTGTSANDVAKRALAEYLQVHGRAELVQSAFERVLNDHRAALDKLADL